MLSKGKGPLACPSFADVFTLYLRYIGAHILHSFDLVISLSQSSRASIDELKAHRFADTPLSPLSEPVSTMTSSVSDQDLASLRQIARLSAADAQDLVQLAASSSSSRPELPPNEALAIVCLPCRRISLALSGMLSEQCKEANFAPAEPESSCQGRGLEAKTERPP